MSFLRPSSNILRSSSRAAPLSARTPPPLRYISSTFFRLSNQGYGEGKGDPAAENSERSTKTQEGHEHPGPAAPERKGSGGGGPTKAKPEDASANSGGSRSKEAKETGSSPTGGQIRNSSVDAEPKIHDNQTPGTGNQEYKKEVEQHNKEFEQGHDRASAAAEDKVDKKFWKGHGGHDGT